MQKLKSYDVAISARGSVEKDFSQVTYYFDYNPNYKMIRVSENRSLYNKLDIEEKEIFTALNNVVNQIKRDNYTDYANELAIHDYIVSTFSYGPTDTDNIPKEAHSIVGFVRNGQGICEAYANTFQLMCRLAGIDSQLVTGSINGVGHMWNIVKIDGDYYHVDVTSDDPAPNNNNKKIYNYFNVTDDMISSTYTWEKENYPSCTATLYNYQNYNNLTVKSKEDLEKLILDGLAKSQTNFTFKTDGYIINNADEIRSILNNKGFSKITITGEYGKDGVFNLTLE
ncbi:MAG: transglutaminase domain-containing protein [Lachnospirales bacterium]